MQKTQTEIKEELQHTRREYVSGALTETEVEHDPVLQFEKWYEEYSNLGLKETNAMTLSTTGIDQKPSSRIVLLKGIDKGGFEFYTNYCSSKARDIEENPNVCLNFYWPQLEKQVRVEGKAFKLEPSESDAYFSIRPRGSQIGAWVSPQSQEIRSRSELEENVRRYEEEFGDKIPRPDFWGGYRVMPEKVEFWQGRLNRLHDRILYDKTENGWTIKRLAP